MTRLQPIIIY